MIVDHYRVETQQLVGSEWRYVRTSFASDPESALAKAVTELPSRGGRRLAGLCRRAIPDLEAGRSFVAVDTPRLRVTIVPVG